MSLLLKKAICLNRTKTSSFILMPQKTKPTLSNLKEENFMIGFQTINSSSTCTLLDLCFVSTITKLQHSNIKTEKRK